MSPLPRSTDVVVVGGGQAGLSTSWHLRQRDREHVILDRGRVGDTWRRRWDAFHLVTPNWQFQLPGAEYDGDAPDAFLPRDEVVRRIEAWANGFGAPFHGGVEVTAVDPEPAGGFTVRTSAGDLRARQVIVAAGTYQEPRLPAPDAGPSGVLNVAAHDYRNAAALPPGGVLVVGSGQSGCQITEDLLAAGRTVHLSVGRAGRVPRRHRGADSLRWVERAGLYDQPITEHELGEAVRFRTHPHVCGAHGGHTLDLRALGRDGAVLHGHLAATEGSRIHFADDLPDLLRGADDAAATFQRLFDETIAKGGFDATGERDEPVRWSPPSDQPLDVDLAAAGISAVIWAAGFKLDFSWVHAPIQGTNGYPIVDRGLTTVPGLAFVGLHWMHTWKSGLLFGVGRDAEYVVDRLTA
jgi:putative flavoprotein involved in K+ transport